MKRIWMIVAGICTLTAAFFLLRGDVDIAFVIAAIGMVSWFLNYRAQMKEITAAADLEQNRENRRAEGGEDSDEK